MINRIGIYFNKIFFSCEILKGFLLQRGIVRFKIVDLFAVTLRDIEK